MLKPSGDASFLEALVTSSTHAVYVKDLHGRYVLVNQAGMAALGRTRVEVLGQDDHALWSRKTAEETMAFDREVHRRGEVMRYRHPDGQHVWQSTKGLLYGPDRTVIGLFGISRDARSAPMGVGPAALTDSTPYERLSTALVQAQNALVEIQDLHRTRDFAKRALELDATFAELRRLLDPSARNSALH